MDLNSLRYICIEHGAQAVRIHETETGAVVCQVRPQSNKTVEEIANLVKNDGRIPVGTEVIVEDLKIFVGVGE